MAELVGLADRLVGAGLDLLAELVELASGGSLHVDGVTGAGAAESRSAPGVRRIHDARSGVIAAGLSPRPGKRSRPDRSGADLPMAMDRCGENRTS
jgi:hypothetical protein